MIGTARGNASVLLLTEGARRLRDGRIRLLRSCDDDLMPLIAGLRQAQARVGSVTGELRRRQRADDVDDLDH